MSLVEVLAVDLGASIAKSILKVWLKDSSIISDAGASLVDILKDRTSDTLAQRRAARQFEEIGEKVGESLLSLFEIDGARLQESDRIAVAIAAKETLDIAKSDVLAQHDLDPIKLAKYLLAKRPPTMYHFAEVESLLYQRIVSESCKYIVDIASQLPDFTEQTFAEVLKRLTQIETKIDQLIREIQQEREKNSPEEREARFESEYRDVVKRTLDKLELFGANVRGDSREQSLSVAYVRLSVKQKVSGIKKTVFHESSKGKNVTRISEDEERRSLVVVDKALAGSKRLLIRGDAGSGKTTLLQWIAVNAAAKSFKEPLLAWNNLVPFYIRLRQHVKFEQVSFIDLPTPSKFPTLISKAIDAPPPNWVIEKLRSGQAIVLIDGVDEIPETQRADVRSWLEELIRTYKQAYFIITSRLPAVDTEDWAAWLNELSFQDALLQPMTLSDIFVFIDHWHEAVAKRLSDPQEKAELPTFAKTLKNEIEQHRSKRDLAKTPLLCAMLCALNRERRKQLPSDRVELYAACCKLLVEQRDRVRGIPLVDYPAADLEYPQKLLLLQDLAYWMMRNGLSEAEVSQVDERFKQKLNSIRNLPQHLYSDEGGIYARKLFIERSSIIREPVVGRIDFSHRSFQEFLSAQAVIGEGDIGVLVQHAHIDQWREVILLAASSIASEKMRQTLIQGLIKRGETEKEYSTSLYLLAAACLETSVEIPEPNLKLRVEQKISNLLPLKSVSDVHALAVAGELAVPYLVRRDENEPKIRAACVEVLGYIGSDEALRILEQYIQDPDIEVTDSLWQIWDFFDGGKRIAYEQRVLCRLDSGPSLQAPLSIARLTSLDAFQQFTELNTLSLKDCEHISDLAPLASLTHLTALSLADCPWLTNLAPLASLTRLTNLSLNGCPRLTNLTSLAALIHLTTLSLTDCPQLRSLIPLASLTKLKVLALSRCRQIRDLSPLTNLRDLRELYLDFRSRILIPQSLIGRVFYVQEFINKNL